MKPKSSLINHIWLLVLAILFIPSCQESEQSSGEQKLFTNISADESGIDFVNKLEETEASNYYQYMYLYIGGGVAAADFNNDGLEDLFFVSNSFDNQLYLNKADFSFEDITEKAGIVKRPGFDAGVSVVDINNDGFLDIYITRGGWIQDDNRFANMLYINNGDLTFTEQAEKHGLADANRSIQAIFFDYDKDGDVDMYLANTPNFEGKGEKVVDLIEVQTDSKTEALKGSDKLYQNDGNGYFTDVSLEAGILPDVGFGLNPLVGDLNNDGWPDIYVCNDFRVPDFVYLNNSDGTFREARTEVVKHMSFNSMGSDFADVNNDGLQDLFTLDMNPEDYVRSKTTMAMTSISMFEEMVDKGYHYNYMHNMLQINNGNGTFSEVSKMAGIADTDWSWACLLADFDLDGYNDIFVTNGVYRDVIDRDANNKILSVLRENRRKPTNADFLAFTQMLPQQKLTNYFYKNNGDLTFDNVSSIWTDSVPAFSNGATYADLDNDGDLDVVVNNLNDYATILKNNAIQHEKGNFISLKLEGPKTNKTGIGATANLYLTNGKRLTRQLNSSRGFLSAVPHTLYFGLNKEDAVDYLEVIWPDGKINQISALTTNQSLTISYKEATEAEKTDRIGTEESSIFTQAPSDHKHIDPYFNDYNKQVLLPHKLSQTGPAIAKGDINGDGKEDLFIGGGHTQPGKLLIAGNNGRFSSKLTVAFERDKQKEDVGATFFDADNDGDLDLYVVSGSYEFPSNSKLLLDRLYLNDGKGNFSKSAGLIPEIPTSGSVVIAGDYDQDGDMDLFVGGRVISGQYPFPPTSMLLVNKNGKFSEETQTLAPELVKAGMVTDAIWKDIDMDEDIDLVITGEWMGIEVFENEAGQLKKSEKYATLSSSTGWWNRLIIEDVDQDGDLDIVAGNLGLNYKFHASTKKPFHVYTNDFDFNGTADVFLAKEYNGVEVPIRGKTCATQQLPHLAQKIPTYNDFANRDLAGILGPSLKSALHYEAVEFRSGIFLNDGNGAFSFTPFSNEVQQSPINSILYQDFDGDGNPDLLMAGNNFMSEVETTRADGGIGTFLKGNGTGNFNHISHQKSGFFAHKDVRNMISISTGNTTWVVVVNNNDFHDFFRVDSEGI